MYVSNAPSFPDLMKGKKSGSEEANLQPSHVNENKFKIISKVILKEKCDKDFFKMFLLTYINCTAGIHCDISVYAHNVFGLGSPPPFSPSI
jgi:hypothetical protein